PKCRTTAVRPLQREGEESGPWGAVLRRSTDPAASPPRSQPVPTAERRWTAKAEPTRRSFHRCHGRPRPHPREPRDPSRGKLPRAGRPSCQNVNPHRDRQPLQPTPKFLLGFATHDPGIKLPGSRFVIRLHSIPRAPHSPPKAGLSAHRGSALRVT